MCYTLHACGRNHAIHGNLVLCARCVIQIVIFFVGRRRHIYEHARIYSWPFLPPSTRAELLAKEAFPSMIREHPSSRYTAPARYNSAPVIVLRTLPGRPYFQDSNCDDPQKTKVAVTTVCGVSWLHRERLSESSQHTWTDNLGAKSWEC